MITPSEITNLSRTHAEKGEFLAFCILCAGKSSETQAQKLNAFMQGSLDYYNSVPSFIAYIQYLLEDGRLISEMQKYKLGKYQLVGDGLKFMAEHPECIEYERDELVSIPGVSYKTASLYRMHTYGDRMACLDTHILRYMRNVIGVNAPKAPPSDKRKYEELELLWLGHCYKHDRTPHEMDLEIWNERAAA